MEIKLLGQTTKREIEKQMQLVAAASKLSRFPGTAKQIHSSSIDYTKNVNYISKIMKLKHKSIAEHDYIAIIIQNVTPIVEQALIENRLCSFTIKSRRLVDFRTAGFHTPEFRDLDGQPHKDNEKLKRVYKKHMQGLFNTYSELVDRGIPVEDARYVLPYCFHSNIIMGLDARELEKITKELLYGELSKIAELKELGEEFKKLAERRAPYLIEEINKNKDNSYDHLAFLDEEILGPNTSYEEKSSTIKKINGIHITEHTPDPDAVIIIALLQKRYQLSREEAGIKYSTMSDELKEKVMNSISTSDEKDARALEQAVFKVEFPISLANATHFARHRMHSPMFPRFVPIWNLENYVTPRTIEENELGRYDQAYIDNKAIYDEFVSRGVNPSDLVYFYQSGNTMNVTSSLNARSLMHICELRQCNNAQWEIRGIANGIASCIEDVAPLLGNHIGPTCKTKGMCNEGRLSCGKPITKQIKGV